MWKTPLSIVTLFGVVILLFATREKPPITSNEIPNAEDEILFIFLQEGDRHFRTITLPQVEQWAKQEGIQLEVKSVTDGIPLDITATPAIIYTNSRGRATYSSRYTEWNTIRNFVRTNRLRPRAEVPFCAATTLQWQQGEGAINAPLKLTSLQGTLPNNHTVEAFQKQALQAINKGMASFQQQATACLARTDRAFYCDIHPFRNQNGSLFLSLEVYSMFNCIRPVFTTGDQPLQGKFADRDALFQEAGAVFESIILKTINESEEGDRWNPIPTDAKTISWESLGIVEAETGTTSEVSLQDFDLASKWNTPQAIVAGVPTLFFNFLPPLDRYAGEVPDFTGAMQLHPDGSLASGQFVAKLQSMTMGMQELDDKVKKKYIFTKRFPEATFSFNLPEQGNSLVPGVVNRIPITGVFEFMKKEIPLTVQAEIIPELNEQKQAQLLIHVDFQLNITDNFGVQGPDGPEEASKNVAFDMNFILSPDNN